MYLVINIKSLINPSERKKKKVNWLFLGHFWGFFLSNWYTLRGGVEIIGLSLKSTKLNLSKFLSYTILQSILGKRIEMIILSHFWPVA